MNTAEKRAKTAALLAMPPSMATNQAHCEREMGAGARIKI
jgi:hypothetical protein